MSCINLKERFGRRFRVDYEESYRAEHGSRVVREVPQLMIVLCRYGEIYPHGGHLLGASVAGHPKVAGQLRRLKCCRVHQDGDFGELTALFDVAEFAQVAKIMRPRRRRQLSPEQRAEMVRRLHPDRQLHAQGPIHGQHTAHTCVPTPLSDSEPTSAQLPLFAHTFPNENGAGRSE